MKYKIFRCFGDADSEYEKYPDEEWGSSQFDDIDLFETLCLEIASSGLSWLTVLKKQDNYRRVFLNFDTKLVSEMSAEDLE